MEWFLKYLLPYISKYGSTLGINTEEDAILRAQHLELIYAQSGIPYDIILDTPQSNHDPKKHTGIHANGIVGSTSAKDVHMINQSVARQVIVLSSTTQ